jgi:tetratricopeptide (TPR) repeat protein
MGRAGKRREKRNPPNPSHGPVRAESLVPSLPRMPAWQLLALVIATLLAFGAAIRAPFQFDDIASIDQNPTIERLWPASGPLTPPRGIAVSGRPAVNYTLAMNHALNDLLGVEQGAGSVAPNKTVGYHAINLLLHVLNGLLLFGIIRRTIRSGRGLSAWSDSANEIAIVVAALWLLHPLQTEAVDYVIQRTELLVSMCYLGTLYASIRAWDAASRRSMQLWYLAAVGACLVGMWSKEVMASAPIAVILYDRVFRFSSWKDAWQSGNSRALFYAALVITLVPLALSIAGGARTDTVGFNLGLHWYEYLYSQGWAIAHYLKLIFWPAELTYDYGTTGVVGLRGIPGLIIVTCLGFATVIAWIRLPWLGFVGTLFFLILAPSSSVVPIRTEIAAERRMYLALAPILIALVAGADWVRRRLARKADGHYVRILTTVLVAVGVAYLFASRWTALQITHVLRGPSATELTPIVLQIGFAAGAVALAWRLVVSHDRRWAIAGLLALLFVVTAKRSALYASPERLWRDAAVKVPTNPRAYDNLAAVVLRSDSARSGEAEGLLRQAIAIDSTYAPGWTNLADIEMQRGRFAAARTLLERALSINPQDVDATARLGGVLVKLGDPRQAIPRLEKVVASYPTDEALATLAQAYLDVGRKEDAGVALRRALALNPRRSDAAAFVGALLAEQGRPDEAIGYLESATRGPATAPLYGLLSVTAAQLGRSDEAMGAANRAATLANDDATTFIQIGRAMILLQNVGAADGYLTRAVQLEPSNLEAVTRLGIVKAAAGNETEAVKLFRRALLVDPTYAPARQALDKVGRR